MSQVVFSGKDSILKLLQLKEIKESKKVLLVCDGAYRYLSVKKFFDSFPVPIVKFSDFTVNPLYEDVCKGVELFNAEGCDLIIAVGGGSTIDVAKCIKLYCKMDPKENFLKQKCQDSGIPLIAVPTTAGTGSESTRFAVVYYKGEKQSVADESIIPNYAVLEADVLRSLPNYQRKCTLLDAFCQAIESWWSVNSTEESIQYSKKAISVILDNLVAYTQETSESSDEGVLNDVFEAANYAGRAINITQTTAAHAMSYKLTSLYHLPHGHAVAVCLPGLFRYMAQNIDKCIDPRGEKYLADVFSEISKALGADNALTAADLFDKLLIRLDILAPVIPERDVELLVNSVNPVRLKNNPIALSSDVLEFLYRNLKH